MPKRTTRTPKRAVITRRYSTLLPMEEYYPDEYLMWSLALDGATVRNETQRFVSGSRPNVAGPDHGGDDGDDDADPVALDWGYVGAGPPTRSVQDHDSPDAALLAFERAVLAELPRVRAPAASDPALLVVGPAAEVPDARRWIRTDGLAEEHPLEHDATGRSLEADAVANPDDPAARLVYADWLASHAGPVARARAELAVAHARMLQGDADAAVVARAWEVLEGYADAWASGLLPYARLGFRVGFLDAVELLGRDDLAATTTGDELAAFLALPVARGVRRLAIGAVGPLAISGNPFCDLEPLVEAVARSERPRLRELVLAPSDAGTDAGSFCDAGSLASLWRALPALESLTSYAFVQKVGRVRAPRLRRLAMEHACGVDVAAAICRGHLPALESLTLRAYGGPLNHRDALAGFGAGDGVPRLRELTLEVAHGSPAAVLALLARGALLPRLESLTVGVAQPDAESARDLGALLADARAFAHLRELRLPTARPSDADRAALGAALPRLRFG